MGLYRFCSGSQIGESHIQDGTKCQDSNYIIENAGIVFAAVADGLGSSKHSDIASQIAAAGSVQYCAANIRVGMTDEQIISVIKTCFDKVNFAIKQKANGALEDYDTTLTLAVFIEGDLHYGHAGDSGIIVLRSDGLLEEVTEPQLGSGQGKERPVYPLASQANWVFGKYKHRARALFLMTDGVLNKAVPPLLENQTYKLDNAYLFYLYDNLCKNLDLNSWVEAELSHLKPQEINYDDKTLAAILCDSVNITLRPNSYYEFPTKQIWNSLLEKHNELLYGPRIKPKPEPNHPEPKPIQPRPVGLRNPKTRSKFSHSVATFAAGFVFGIITVLAIMLSIDWTSKSDSEPIPSRISPQPSVVNTISPSLTTPTPTASAAPTSPTVNSLTGEVRINNYEPRINDTLSCVFIEESNNTGELVFSWMAGDQEVGIEETYVVKLDDLGKQITLVVRSSIETGVLTSKLTAPVRKIIAPDSPSIPELESRTSGSITLVVHDGYEYSIDGNTWTDSSVFNNLEADTEYHAFQRVRETDDTEASETSDGITIRTRATTRPTSPDQSHPPSAGTSTAVDSTEQDSGDITTGTTTDELVETTEVDTTTPDETDG